MLCFIREGGLSTTVGLFGMPHCSRFLQQVLKHWLATLSDGLQLVPSIVQQLSSSIKDKQYQENHYCVKQENVQSSQCTGSGIVQNGAHEWLASKSESDLPPHHWTLSLTLTLDHPFPSPPPPNVADCTQR